MLQMFQSQTRFQFWWNEKHCLSVYLSFCLSVGHCVTLPPIVRKDNTDQFIWCLTVAVNSMVKGGWGRLSTFFIVSNNFQQISCSVLWQFYFILLSSIWSRYIYFGNKISIKCQKGASLMQWWRIYFPLDRRLSVISSTFRERISLMF